MSSLFTTARARRTPRAGAPPRGVLSDSDQGVRERVGFIGIEERHLGEIREVAERIGAISTSVPEAVEEQTVVTGEVAANVGSAAGQVRVVVRSVAEVERGAAESLGAAEEVTAVAAELEALVGSFQVDA